MNESSSSFDELLETLEHAAAALREADVRFVLGGGLAIWARGGPETEHDIDFFVRAEDAERALRALEAAGFRPDEPPVTESRLSPPLLFGPALALLAVAIGVAFTPGLGDRATRWAQRFEDRPAHAVEVFAGKLPPPPAVPRAPVHAGVAPYAYSFASLAGAVAFALFGLYRRRLPHLLRGWAGRLLDPPVKVLKELHSGVVGDYVAWLTFGIAALGGLVALLGR